MPYFALIYHYSPDYLARRGEFRDGHLALVRAAHARGEIVLAGAFTDPADTGLYAWHCADRSAPEQFVAADPYVRAGLVTRWELRDWSVVVGGQ